MRVSTMQVFNASLRSMQEQESSVSRTQLQLASGKKLLAPADDPVAAADILALKGVSDSTDQFQRNIESLQSRLALEETVLDSVTNVLQRVRELAVRANNDSLTSLEKRAIATEMREMSSELLALANSRDGQGDYLFAGFKGGTKPFSRDAAGNYLYNGDDGQRSISIGWNRELADGDPGSTVFMRLRDGNGTFVSQPAAGNTGTGIIDVGQELAPAGYTGDSYSITFDTNSAGQLVYLVSNNTLATPVLPASGLPDDATIYNTGDAINFDGIEVSIQGLPLDGDIFLVVPSRAQDMFSSIDQMISRLATAVDSDRSRTQLHNDVGRFMVEMDRAMEHLLSVRTRVGSRMVAMDNHYEINAGLALQTQTDLSRIQDLDYAEASSRFQRQLLALQAAQQTFARVQSLSLFNFIR